MEAPDVNNLLPRLQRWYYSQCDGDWEHSWGVKIATLDNPGWSLEVDLQDTELQDRPFAPIERGVENSDVNPDWLTCFVKDGRFKGRGGPNTLADLIATFLNWAEREQGGG
jgi:hypothetical protein